MTHLLRFIPHMIALQPYQQHLYFEGLDVPVFVVVLVGAPHPAGPVGQGQLQGLVQEGLEHQAGLLLDLQQGDGLDGRRGGRAPAILRHHGCSERERR